MSSKREIIQLHVGQAGLGLVDPCWNLYCLEHGINSNYRICPCQSSTWKNGHAFFSCLDSGKIVPRILMVDMDKYFINKYRTGNYRKLFHPNSIIGGFEDASSNFARGYMLSNSYILEDSLEWLRKMAENCSSLEGFFMFRAIGGGTGSGFGARLWEHISEDYGKAAKIELDIFPSLKTSPLVLESYNSILATHMSMDIVDCSILIENSACYDICADILRINAPHYEHLNQVISQAISAITSPFRFDGPLKVGLNDFKTKLVPFSRLHFPTVSYAPLALPYNKSEKRTINQLTHKCFEPENQLLKINPNTCKYMSCMFLYRGNIKNSDVNTIIDRIKMEKSMKFFNLSSNCIEVGLNYQLPFTFLNKNSNSFPITQSVCMLANNTAIRNKWKILHDSYRKMLSRKAFLHHFVEYGVEEENFYKASENISNLIDEYKEIDETENVS